jgi:hypothetical protein
MPLALQIADKLGRDVPNGGNGMGEPLSVLMMIASVFMIAAKDDDIGGGGSGETKD